MLAGALPVLLAGAPSAGSAQEIVWISGNSQTFQEGNGTDDARKSLLGLLENRDALNRLCKEEGGHATSENRIGTGLGKIGQQIQNTLAKAGATKEEIDHVMTEYGLRAEAMADITCREPEHPKRGFNVIYGQCRMTMIEPPMLMDLLIPAGTSTGIMTIMEDVQTGAGTTYTFDMTVLNKDTGIVTGAEESARDNTGMRIAGMRVPNYVKKTGEKSRDIIGYTTTQYEFRQGLRLMKSMVLPPAQEGADPSAEIFGAKMVMMLPTVQSTGTAWIAAHAPGVDIMRSFYKNFASAVESGPAGLLGGLFNHVLLEHGMPLDLNQTTAVIMNGARW